MGIDKKSKKKPGANTRKKVSEYGLQLREKQKVKFIYGIMEKQFAHYFNIAEKKKGITGENLLVTLESRLDNVVFRAGLAGTRREARQLVVHGHYLINGKNVNIPSYLFEQGDVITLKDSSRSSEKFKSIVDSLGSRVAPSWIALDKINVSATIQDLPKREDIDFEVQEHLIVELYSK
jgi:small subunit ribosomal protein S4